MEYPVPGLFGLRIWMSADVVVEVDDEDDEPSEADALDDLPNGAPT